MTIPNKDWDTSGKSLFNLPFVFEAKAFFAMLKPSHKWDGNEMFTLF